MVTLAAPAKANLWLRIGERREDGYHSLDTLFCALSLADEVRAARAEAGIALEVSGGVDTGAPEKNLAVRAAESFYAALGEEPAVRLELHKRIPSAAGLGGGSSDAAATLRALNRLHGDPLDAEALLSLGATLGSDVPFFLGSSPLALGMGRGEVLMPLPPLPARPVLVAHPGEAMSTAEAFRRLAEQRAAGGAARPEAIAYGQDALGAWTEVAARAGNDFESPAFERIPRLAAARDAMRAAGAEIALLAGSGASLFGIFASEGARDAAARGVEGLGFATWRAETLTTWPEPVLGAAPD